MVGDVAIPARGLELVDVTDLTGPVARPVVDPGVVEDDLLDDLVELDRAAAAFVRGPGRAPDDDRSRSGRDRGGGLPARAGGVPVTGRSPPGDNEAGPGREPAADERPAREDGASGWALARLFFADVSPHALRP